MRLFFLLVPAMFIYSFCRAGDSSAASKDFYGVPDPYLSISPELAGYYSEKPGLVAALKKNKKKILVKLAAGCNPVAAAYYPAAGNCAGDTEKLRELAVNEREIPAWESLDDDSGIDPGLIEYFAARHSQKALRKAAEHCFKNGELEKALVLSSEVSAKDGGFRSFMKSLRDYFTSEEYRGILREAAKRRKLRPAIYSVKADDGKQRLRIIGKNLAEAGEAEVYIEGLRLLWAEKITGEEISFSYPDGIPSGKREIAVCTSRGCSETVYADMNVVRKTMPELVFSDAVYISDSGASSAESDGNGIMSFGKKTVINGNSVSKLRFTVTNAGERPAEGLRLVMNVNCSQGIAGLTYGYDKAVGSLKQNESRTVTVDFETDYGFKKRDITLEFSPLADGPYKPAGKAFVLFGGGHKCVAAKKIYKKK